jgi:hypothetical protein
MKVALVLALFSALGSVGIAARDGSASAPLASRIAYLRDGDIYLFDLVTKQTTRITTRGDIVNLSWSSDGQQIAFESKADIYTMKADGTAITPVAISSDDEMTPDYYGTDAIYYVKRTNPYGEQLNSIIMHNLSGEEREVYKELGGLCHITDLDVATDSIAVISRNCGRGKNVSAIGIGKAVGTETFLGNDKCEYGGVTLSYNGTVATTQTDCELDVTTANIAIFDNAGKRTHLFNTPDNGFGLLDWDDFGGSLVYGSENGLWLVNATTGKATRLSDQGGLPRWWQEAPPPLPTEYEIGMPGAGQAQTNDLLAWGALAACVIIAVGLLLVSRRRRRDRDGL